MIFTNGDVDKIIQRRERVRVTVNQHRERMRAAGLRPIQLWVPDTRSPKLAAEVRHQCINLKEDLAEAEITCFSKEAVWQIEGWK